MVRKDYVVRPFKSLEGGLPRFTVYHRWSMQREPWSHPDREVAAKLARALNSKRRQGKSNFEILRAMNARLGETEAA